MSKKGSQIAIILIIAVWVLSLWKFGLTIVGLVIAFVGTCFICAALNGSVEAKSHLHLANKYNDKDVKK